MYRRTDNAAAIHHATKRSFARDSHLRIGDKPALGSHLVIARTLYSHHGIYVGNDHVIHYAGAGHGLRRGSVEEVSLEHFSHGRGIRVRHDRPRFGRRQVLARARSRLGERSYRVLTNNCEHLCEWCLNGANRSSQVERWLSGVRRLTCALLATLGLVAGAPSLAGSASEHATPVEAGTLAFTLSTYAASAPLSRGEQPGSRFPAGFFQQEIAAAAVHMRVERDKRDIQPARSRVVVDSAHDIAGCGRTVAAAAGPGPPGGRWTFDASRRT